MNTTNWVCLEAKGVAAPPFVPNIFDHISQKKHSWYILVWMCFKNREHLQNITFQKIQEYLTLKHQPPFSWIPDAFFTKNAKALDSLKKPSTLLWAWQAMLNPRHVSSWDASPGCSGCWCVLALSNSLRSEVTHFSGSKTGVPKGESS